MASWQTALGPLTIDFAADKLDEIRIAVVDGFYAVPRGGVEIGGVLFGKLVEDRLSIVDYRIIETEYLTGPSFRLSESDLAGMRKLLAETAFADTAVGPVGWFHSHTRSGIQLSAQDLDFHKRYFPEPWQVALVLKPDNLGAVRAGYFFRQSGGVMKADSPVNEFTLRHGEGQRKQPQRKAVEQARLEEVKPEIPVGVPVMAAAPITPVMPVKAEAPVTPVMPVIVDAPLFQSIGQQSVWPMRKRLLFALLALALIGAAGAGYWAATT